MTQPSQPLTTQTVICLDNNHAHADPRQDIIHMSIAGHSVTVESERGSQLYSVWIDGQERGTFIPSEKLDELIQEL